MSPRHVLPIVGRTDRLAERNRARLDLNGVFAVNLVGPGDAGGTAFTRRTIDALAGHRAMPVQIDGPAPLCAGQLARALEPMPLRGLDVLLVHNAAPQVCPGSCKLGAHVNVRVTTVFDRSLDTLSDPHLYRDVDALVVHRMEQAAAAGFDDARFLWRLARINPNRVVFLVSNDDARGLSSWVEWIARRRQALFRGSGRSAPCPIPSSSLPSAC